MDAAWGAGADYERITMRVLWVRHKKRIAAGSYYTAGGRLSLL